MANGSDGENALPTPWPKDPKGGNAISRKNEDGEDVDAGFVYRGTKDVAGRPHIYMWFTQSRQSQKQACEDSATYSFQQPSVTLSTANGTWDLTEKAKALINGEGKKLKPVGTTIGGEMVWGEPYPDYQPDWVKKEDAERKKRKLKPFPPVSRPGARPGEKQALPYAPRSIPGTNDEGFVDSPDSNKIDKSGRTFSGETLKRIITKDRKLDPKKPPGGKKADPDFPGLPEGGWSTQPNEKSIEVTMKIKTHFTTLLYCLDPFGCLGMFEWDSTETDVYSIVVEETQPYSRWDWSPSLVSSKLEIDMGPWGQCA
jgi:hypothetical protein